MPLFCSCRVNSIICKNFSARSYIMVDHMLGMWKFWGSNPDLRKHRYPLCYDVPCFSTLWLHPQAIFTLYKVAELSHISARGKPGGVSCAFQSVRRSHKLPGQFPRLTAALPFFCAHRAAWQTSTADPSLPVGAALCFSVWRLFDKRKKRAPEGGDLGRSPIWGAVGVTLFGLFLGSLVRVSPLGCLIL